MKQIHLASHYGMCFGVRDALKEAENAAQDTEITILGQLVHNPVVSERMQRLGAKTGDLSDLNSAGSRTVLITAHGAADAHRAAWKNAGYQLRDTTCPLVHRAHQHLSKLVAEGRHPVVIGQKGHAEVRGLIGDFPNAIVVLDSHDLENLKEVNPIGIISQTTQPSSYVEELVVEMRTRYPEKDIKFVNTVCQPTRQRQKAVEELAKKCDLIVVIGGNNSNNTRQLAESARQFSKPGTKVYRIERASDLMKDWFEDDEVRDIGITAGTSTLEETVQEVYAQIQTYCASGEQQEVAVTSL